MALIGKASASIEKFIGISNSKVIAFNPTQTELITLGINVKEEPVYTNVDQYKDGRSFTVFKFWLEDEVGGQKVRNSLTILANKNRVTETKTGKQIVSITNGKLREPSIRVISEKIPTAEAAIAEITNNSEMLWFYNEQPVVALAEGQYTLFYFLSRWLGLSGTELFEGINFDKLVDGDFKELKETAAHPDNQNCRVNVLLHATTSNDKTYVNAYDKWFGYGGTVKDRSYEALIKVIEKVSNDGTQYNIPKGVYMINNEIPRSLVILPKQDEIEVDTVPQTGDELPF